VKFDRVPSSPFYEAALMHAEGSGAFGDNPKDPSQQPLNWLVQCVRMASKGVKLQVGSGGGAVGGAGAAGDRRDEKKNVGAQKPAAQPAAARLAGTDDWFAAVGAEEAARNQGGAR
jgi:hypothetical protein